MPLVQEPEIKPVVMLEGSSKDSYLQNLYEFNSMLTNYIFLGSILNSSMANYYARFSDIVSILMNDTRQKITVSNNSGLPMYSNIYSIMIDKKRFSENNNSRNIKEISKDLADAIYINHQDMITSFFDEYKRARYNQSVKEIKHFDDNYSSDIIKPKNKRDIFRHISEFCGYPISEMSCMTMYTEIYRPKSLIEKFGSYINKSFFNKFSGDNIEHVYKLMLGYGYPGTIVQTKLKFYFPEKHSEEGCDINSLMNQKDAYALEMKISKLDNLDILVASNKGELKSSNTDDYQIEENHIYVASESIHDQLSGILCEKGLKYKLLER